MKEYQYVDRLVSIRDSVDGLWHDGWIVGIAPYRRGVKIAYPVGTRDMRWTNRHACPERGGWLYR
jgi:hypothetical protein